jgi:hypothetical protein
MTFRFMKFSFAYPVCGCFLLFFLLLTLLLPSRASAGTVTDSLQNAQFVKLDNGILVYGTKKNNSACFFKATRYDSVLKPVFTITKRLNAKEVISIQVQCSQHAFLFRISCDSSGQTGGFIRTDETLHEISTSFYTKEDYKKYKMLWEKKDLGNYCIPFSLLENPLSQPMLFEGNLFELSIDTLKYDYQTHAATRAGKNRMVIRRFEPKEQKLWTVYHVKWETELQNLSFFRYKFLLCTGKFIFLYVNDMKGESWGQYIYCIDYATGKLIYRTRLQTDKAPVFIYSNHYYEPGTGDLLVAGNNHIISPAERKSGVSEKNPVSYMHMSQDVLLRISPDGKITNEFSMRELGTSNGMESGNNFGNLIVSTQKILPVPGGGYALAKEVLFVVLKNGESPKPNSVHTICCMHDVIIPKDQWNKKTMGGGQGCLFVNPDASGALTSGLPLPDKCLWNDWLRKTRITDDLIAANSEDLGFADYAYEAGGIKACFLTKTKINYSGKIITTYYSYGAPNSNFCSFHALPEQFPDQPSVFSIRDPFHLYRLTQINASVIRLSIVGW